MQLLANILFGLGMLAVSLLLIVSGLFLTHAYYISPEGAHWIFSFTAPLFTDSLSSSASTASIRQETIRDI